MRQFQARPSNFNKSSITFGTKVNNTVKTKMRSLLGIHNDGGIGKYLGLPDHVGNKKSELFAYIVDKIPDNDTPTSNPPNGRIGPSKPSNSSINGRVGPTEAVQLAHLPSWTSPESTYANTASPEAQ
ncbi:BnaC04g19460D [Brassica napus]|uniref:BnaC04g19460D protein n=3 Tax=Brassica TaxID=3705 RepID=A0A078F6B1_BRANA|nr:BnaC04g19460D [Brassica napus]VDD08927.1 unnamed protein product [Brassica oleracea]